MSNTIPSLSIALIAALVGSAAYADTDSGTTRAQVRAQTMAAIRNGDIIEGNGLTARAMEPGMYPAAPAVAGKTRAEVEAELATALRNGDVIEGNGLTARAMEPGMYPAPPAVAGATRAQVKAELAQAIRSGSMPAPGRITMTQRQEDFPQLYS